MLMEAYTAVALITYIIRLKHINRSASRTCVEQNTQRHYQPIPCDAGSPCAVRRTRLVLKIFSPETHDASYMPGWDCHGLPIEDKALKELKVCLYRMPVSPLINGGKLHRLFSRETHAVYPQRLLGRLPGKLLFVKSRGNEESSSNLV
jgi:hypothetical protein